MVGLVSWRLEAPLTNVLDGDLDWTRSTLTAACNPAKLGGADAAMARGRRESVTLLSRASK